jgi:hypothetical protein
MAQLSKNFTEKEATCKCGKCKFIRPAESSIVFIQMLRSFLAAHYEIEENEIRIVPTSWVRCPTWNKHEGGSVESRHQYIYHADAIDFKCYVVSGESQYGVPHWNKIDPVYIHDLLDSIFPNSMGLGLYHNRNHVDCRSKKARWNNR